MGMLQISKDAKSSYYRREDTDYFWILINLNVLVLHWQRKKIYDLNVTEHGEAVYSYEFNNADGEDADRCGDSLHPLLFPHQCTLGKSHGEIRETKS
jgi:hypothetical protein